MSEDDGARLAARVERLEAEVERLKQALGTPSIAPAPPLAHPSLGPPPEPPPPHLGPPPPQAVPPPAPPPPAVPRQRADEATVVGAWLARAGALAVVVGAGFAFKYAVDRGIITPLGRVLLGIAAGFALGAAAEWARRRGWPGWAQAVAGGAIALWYLSIWAASQLYGILPPLGALAALSLVSAAAVALALRHDSEALSVVATVGAFLNPFLIGVLRAVPPAAYALAVDLGVVALFVVRGWRNPIRVAFLATWVIAGITAARAGLAISLPFGAVFFALFAFVALGSPRLRHALTPGERVPLLLANSLAFTSFGLAEIAGHADGWTAAFAAGLGAAHLVVGLLAVRDAERRPLRLALLAAGVALLALAVPLHFEGPALPAVWTAQALVLLVVASRRDDRRGRALGAGLLGLAVLENLVVEWLFSGPPSRLLVSPEGIVLAFQVVSLGIAAVLTPRTTPADRAWRTVFMVAGNLVAVGWLTLEVRAHYDRPYLEGVPLEDIPALEQSSAFTTTVVWAVYAAALLAFGIVRRSLPARLFGLGLFAAVVLKLVLSDLWLLDPLFRTVAFVGLGALLLASSLGYHRFRDLVLGEPD